MSDEHFKGGHELEGLNTRLLFQLFVGLSLVTFLAAVAVVQWFYRQRNELIFDRAAQGSFILDQHDGRMDNLLKDMDGTREAVLADPSLLAADEPPAGWIHPDDVKGGAPAAEDPDGAMDDGEGGETDGAAGETDGAEEAAGETDGAEEAAGETEGDAEEPEDDAAEDAADDSDHEEKAEEKADEKAEEKAVEKPDEKPEKAEEKAEEKPADEE